MIVFALLFLLSAPLIAVFALMRPGVGFGRAQTRELAEIEGRRQDQLRQISQDHIKRLIARLETRVDSLERQASAGPASGAA